MHKYTITLETDAEMNPGNLSHVIALVSNPTNRNYVKFNHEEV